MVPVWIHLVPNALDDGGSSDPNPHPSRYKCRALVLDSLLQYRYQRASGFLQYKQLVQSGLNDDSFLASRSEFQMISIFLFCFILQFIVLFASKIATTTREFLLCLINMSSKGIVSQSSFLQQSLVCPSVVANQQSV